MAKARQKVAARNATADTPQAGLTKIIDEALAVAKTARKHRQPLNGLNFYANKLANLRADATNVFGVLSGTSVGDTTALAELLQKVFSVDAIPKDRGQAARDIQFGLR